MTTMRERRLELGLTLVNVTARLKEINPCITMALVLQMEMGVCLPTEEVLCGLEKILGADRTELFGELPLFAVAADPKPPRPMTQVLARMIPFGRDNAILREALAYKLGVSDRHMRKYISDARADGLLIVNASDGCGYYQTEDINEIRRQYRQEKARLKTIYAAMRKMRSLLVAAGEKV